MAVLDVHYVYNIMGVILNVFMDLLVLSSERIVVMQVTLYLKLTLNISMYLFISCRPFVYICMRPIYVCKSFMWAYVPPVYACMCACEPYVYECL